ncbi:MAG TPA: 50S ribosomal protein L11 methyltransferase [Candidatus Acidoferrales bacterium]|jgi:ribosomal protein L11 methyltransferase|nr:50S ribosomal protein L11 methyltransferase [Candidatus Acidoferrales bacterium]
MNTRRRLWAVSVVTTLEAEDAVAQMLADLFGCPPSSYFDFESQTSRVCVYLQGEIASNARQRLKEGLGRIKDCNIEIGQARISIARVRKEDWAESWKRHFKPIEFEDLLLVKPGWSKKKPRKNQAVVILDPGLCFGTGQHPTTAFCLNEIARNSPRRKTAPVPANLQKNEHAFLDIGSGSGILAISAAKLGYAPVRGMDFDGDAVRAARANARRNGVNIRFVRGDVAQLPGSPKRRYHFICANLISGLLVQERERITAQLDRNGILVLAGILRREFSEVRREYEELGMKMVSTKSEKEWQSGSFCF